MAECIVHIDMLNDQPFLEFIQRAIDLRNVAERNCNDPVLAETIREFDEWFDQSRD